MALHALRSLFCIPKSTSREKKSSNNQPSDEENSPSKKTDGKAHSSNNIEGTLDDQPPPYSPPSPQNLSEKNLPFPSPSLRDPTDKTSSPTIRICPHDILTLERFNRIIALPKFTTNSAHIDALTPTTPHHHRSDDNTTPTHRLGHDNTTPNLPQDSCRPLSIALNDSCVSNLKGFGTYTYSSYCKQRGLLLSFHWELTPLPAWELKCRSHYSTASELAKFLKKTRIRLCEHKRMWDMDIVEAVHPIIHGEATPNDPIERYLAKEGGLDCKKCGARITVYLRTEGSKGKTCRVDTMRWIGKEGARLVARGDDHGKE